MKIKTLIILITIVITMIYILIGFFVSVYSKNECKLSCNNQEALTYIWKAGGGLITTENDVCICIFDDSIEAFKLGGYEDDKD